MALGDVNGDGNADLIEGAPGSVLYLDDPPIPGHLTYCAGTPNGPIACRRILGSGPGPASLAVADVTGDRRPDVIAGVPVIRVYNEDESVPGAVLILPGSPTRTHRPEGRIAGESGRAKRPASG